MEDATSQDTSQAFVADTSPVASYFEITNPNEKVSAKVEAISNYLRGDKKEYDDIDMLRDLKQMLFKLGTPPLGESLFDMAYHYSKINSQIKDLEDERSRFER